MRYPDATNRYLESIGLPGARPAAPFDISTETYHREEIDFAPLAKEDDRKLLFKTRYRDRVRRINERVAAVDPYDILDTNGCFRQFGLMPGYRTASESGTVVIELEPGVLLKVNPDYTPDDIRGYAASRRRAEGMDSLEQLICCNDEEGSLGVVVQEAPGLTVDVLTQAEKEEIPDEHLERLADAVREMRNRGLIPDFIRPENVIYQRGSKPGFVIIDYTTIEEEFKLEVSPKGFIPPTIAEIAEIFGTNVLLHNLPPGSTVPGYAVRYYEACKRRLGDEAAAEILKGWRAEGFMTFHIK